MSDRDKLKCTFNSAARCYHQARPDYPDALYDALTSLARLNPGDRLLEIGCATGKATIPLARRGFRITAVEIGPELAAEARQNLAGFPAVAVVTAPIEAWRPSSAAFDLVFAATAWHWIDPAVKYQKAFELLRPDGHLAFWAATHVFPVGGDGFFRDIQTVYEEIGEARPTDGSRPAPGQLPDDTAEILASGLFEQVRVRHFDWETSY